MWRPGALDTREGFQWLSWNQPGPGPTFGSEQFLFDTLEQPGPGLLSVSISAGIGSQSIGILRHLGDAVYAILLAGSLQLVYWTKMFPDGSIPARADDHPRGVLWLLS